MINVVNKHKFESQPDEHNVYIGRGSVFGNPFTSQPLKNTKAIYQCSSREESISNYKSYMEEQYVSNEIYRRELDKLVDYNNNNETINLICYCKPKPCHGDIIKAFIETKKNNTTK